MDVFSFFGECGPIAQSLSNFEYRNQQVEMAQLVDEAFSCGKIAIIEAGTGTGKSLAYLVPALHWAKQSGEKVIVSTNTINLQEQLINKDLPFLADILNFDFRYALVKGWSNYLCHYRLKKARLEESEIVGQARMLAELALFSQQSESGSRSEVGFSVPPQIWEMVCCESDLCLKHQCPHFSRCFYFNERRKAMASDVLVVNHHLLLSDLNIRKHVGYDATIVLPAYSRVIIDEAHHLEDTAADHFTVSISQPSLEQLIGRLYRRYGRTEGGVLSQVLRTVCSLTSPLPDEKKDFFREIIEWEILPGLRELSDRSHGFFQQLRSFLLKHRPPGQDNFVRLQSREQRTAWNKHLGELNTRLGEDLDKLACRLGDLCDEFSTLADGEIEDSTGTLVSLGALVGRIKSFNQTRSFLTGFSDQDYVFWGEIDPSPRVSCRLSACPIAVGQLLREDFFLEMDTVVLTSATLSVGGDFSFLRNRLGLDELDDPSSIREAAIESPFNYEKQVSLAIPTDLPDPNAPDYPGCLASALCQWVRASRGRAFVLFTSYGLLSRVHKEVSSRLPAEFTVLRQGDRPRHQLLDTFKASDNTVLFGTDSFWEGVDVPGSNLSLVVITRLPFQVPTDPVLVARLERLSEAGYNPFSCYQVPQAVIKLKQGFGRLIRHRDDRGVVVICDNRILGRRYGRVFFQSLPKCRLSNCSVTDLTRLIESELA